MDFMKLCVFCFIFSVSTCQEYISYDELYASGLEAYWNENWESAITYFESALQSYKASNKGIQECSELCLSELTSNSGPLSDLEYIFNKANCLENCEDEKFGDSRSVTRVSDDTKNIFQTKFIYKYLQFAYFRGGYYNESVAVTNTYNLFDPEDKMMSQNLKYYLQNSNTTEEMLINLEAVPHVEQYNLGVDFYNAENYEKSIEYFESGLTEFYLAEQGCEAVCEGEYSEKGEYSDDPTLFHQSFVDHYQSVLECKMKCPEEVSRTKLKSTEPNFLPKLYFYLQLAYLKTNEKAKAVSCIKSYLLFYPDSKIMKENLQKYQLDNIQPREEASKFIYRLKLLSKSLKYIYKNFGIQNYDKNLLNPYSEEFPENEEEKINLNEKENKNKILDNKEQKEIPKDKKNQGDPELLDESATEYVSTQHKTNDIISSKDKHNMEMERLRQKRMSEADPNHGKDVDISWIQNEKLGRATVDSNYIQFIVDSSSLPSTPVPEGPVIFKEATLLANSSQMNGPTRFAMDGMADEDQCQDLIDLVLSAGLNGDGYKGRSSPHTNSELFQGINVHRAAELAEQGKLPLSIAKTYYDISERVLQQVAAYFKLDELYFDYTHLVCRTALKNEEIKGLSHPVHGDNCILYADGSCIKEQPAYTWRDYSAILYLNHNFEGGEFIMTDNTAKRVLLQVTPKCGRLVSFGAGGDCLHGVKPVTRGRRCAVALWFTQDLSHNEQLRIEAKQILDRLGAKEEL